MLRKMLKRYIFLFFLCTQLLTGCWDATDVKNMVIPTIAGFDYQNGKYVILMNYPVFGDVSEKSDVLRIEGKTPGQAHIDMGNKSPRIVSEGDLRGFVVGKELAARGIQGVFGGYLRLPSVSLKTLLVVFDGQTEDLFYIKPKHYSSVGNNVLDIMRNSSRNNFIPDEDLHQFMINVFTNGYNPVLPVIRIHHQDKLEVSGAALFKKFQMVAMVNATDMRTLTWLRGEPANGSIFIELEDDNGKMYQLTFFGSNERKVKAEMVDGKPVFEVEVLLRGMVLESLNGLRYAGHEENVRLVETALAEQVQQQCEGFIEDLQQKYRVDAILIGKCAREHLPELVKRDWDKVFCDSEVKVKVKVTILGTGELS